MKFLIIINKINKIILIIIMIKITCKINKKKEIKITKIKIITMDNSLI